MAQTFSSFHVCGPSGAQYLAASTSSRAFSGHVDGSEISTRAGAWMLFAVPRRTMVNQGPETHRISLNPLYCWKQKSSDLQPQIGRIQPVQPVKVVVVEYRSCENMNVN